MTPGHDRVPLDACSKELVGSDHRLQRTHRNKQTSGGMHPGVGVRLQPPPKAPNSTQQVNQARKSKIMVTNKQVPSHANVKQVRPNAYATMNTIDHSAARKQLTPTVRPAQKKQAQRRNRLGQRARRALSEKLHGKQANHVKPEPASCVKAAGSIAKDAEVEPPKGPEESGHLRGVVDESHPSWVAKRHQKALSRLKPTGRKTVFKDGAEPEAVTVISEPPVTDTPVVGRKVEVWAASKNYQEAPAGGAVKVHDSCKGGGRSWGDVGRKAVASFVPDFSTPVPRKRLAMHALPDVGIAPAAHAGMGQKPNDEKLEGLHPSWVAAKRRKIELAKLQILSNSAASKKITFDDD
eukprot:jgi/Ulvmu1/5842/UM025_0101.1